jgi:hypothetical protein
VVEHGFLAVEVDEFLERERRSHEGARQVLDGLAVLEGDRVSDVRGEARMLPGDEPARKILRDRMPLDEAGEQALAERLHHGIGVPALEGVKGAVVGESPVGRQEVWVWMTGVPVTAGFVGKFYLFNAAVSVGGTGVALAIVGVVMSVVSAYYYLGVAVAMYMRDPVGEDEWSAVSPAAGVALAVSVAVTLLLGVFPAPVLTLARLAARSLVS